MPAMGENTVDTGSQGPDRQLVLTHVNFSTIKERAGPKAPPLNYYCVRVAMVTDYSREQTGRYVMSGVNKVILVGNLGRDPEMRYTPSGTAVANFTVATSERFTDKSGDKQERTEWHRIVAWGRLAEICNEYLRKGKQVYLEGRLQTREWEDKDGNKKYTTEIVAREMQMLGRAGDAPMAAPSGDAPEEGVAQAQAPAGGADDDDLPF